MWWGLLAGCVHFMQCKEEVKRGGSPLIFSLNDSRVQGESAAWTDRQSWIGWLIGAGYCTQNTSRAKFSDAQTIRQHPDQKNGGWRRRWLRFVSRLPTQKHSWAALYRKMNCIVCLNCIFPAHCEQGVGATATYSCLNHKLQTTSLFLSTPQQPLCW